AARDRLAHVAELVGGVRDFGFERRRPAGSRDRWRRSAADSGPSLRWGDSCGRTFKVGLDDAAAGAAAGQRLEVDPLFGGEALGERAGLDALALFGRPSGGWGR